MKGLLVKDYLMLSAQRRFMLLALIMMIVISVSANNGLLCDRLLCLYGIPDGNQFDQL